jgi:hypothetical protein
MTVAAEKTTYVQEVFVVVVYDSEPDDDDHVVRKPDDDDDVESYDVVQKPDDDDIKQAVIDVKLAEIVEELEKVSSSSESTSEEFQNFNVGLFDSEEYF